MKTLNNSFLTVQREQAVKLVDILSHGKIKYDAHMELANDLLLSGQANFIKKMLMEDGAYPYFISIRGQFLERIE